LRQESTWAVLPIFKSPALMFVFRTRSFPCPFYITDVIYWRGIILTCYFGAGLPFCRRTMGGYWRRSTCHGRSTVGYAHSQI